MVNDPAVVRPICSPAYMAALTQKSRQLRNKDLECTVIAGNHGMHIGGNVRSAMDLSVLWLSSGFINIAAQMITHLCSKITMLQHLILPCIFLTPLCSDTTQRQIWGYEWRIHIFSFHRDIINGSNHDPNLTRNTIQPKPPFPYHLSVRNIRTMNI